MRPWRCYRLQVVALCWSGFYHLCQLCPVLRSLTHEAARTLVQAFISCRLDYCNSLLYGVSHGNIRKVQSVQNAAARLLTGTRRGDHISPVLRQLHWLPVQRQVDFKLACFVFSSLSGQAPSYLADDIPTDRVLFHAHTTHSVTVLLLLGHVSGTASEQTYATRTSPTRVSGVNLKRTGFLAAGAQCDILLNCAIQIEH